MPYDRCANILIWASLPELAKLWRGLLVSWEGFVWLSPADMPGLARPELVLTDRPFALDSLPPTMAKLVQDVGPGVIRLGGEGPCDVRLPDVDAAQLELACQLLAQIVRLRRQVQSGAALHHELFRQALTDPLTGLPNRRSWDDTLPLRIAAACGGDHFLCLALLDIDQFKQVNTDHGYAAGDAVLRAAGAALHEGLRPADFAARLGGDEFGLVVEVPTPDAAERLVERVRSHMAAAASEALGCPVTVSAGISFEMLSDDATPSPTEIVSAADAALRRSKSQGRDRLSMV